MRAQVDLEESGIEQQAQKFTQGENLGVTPEHMGAALALPPGMAVTGGGGLLPPEERHL